MPNSNYILFIAGSRHFNAFDEGNKELATKYFSEIFDKYGYPNEIVHGGARGADITGANLANLIHIERLKGEIKITNETIDGEEFVKVSGIVPPDIKVFPAEWSKYGKRAGPVRNKQMVDYMISTGKPVVAIVFYIPESSRGSSNMVSQLKTYLPNAPRYEVNIATKTLVNQVQD